MASTMNKAWWAKTKEKDLDDPGDSVERALDVWDTCKKGKDFDKIAKALQELQKKATKLKADADKTKHKKAFALLEDYMENCKEGLGNLDKANGTGIFNNITNLPKSILDDLKNIDKIFWVSYEDTLLFLKAMKSGKGSQKIYDEYIKLGGKRQVNEEAVPNAMRKAIKEAIDSNAEDEKWDDPAWAAVVTRVKSWLKNQGPPALSLCENLEKMMLVEAMRNM